MPGEKVPSEQPYQYSDDKVDIAVVPAPEGKILLRVGAAADGVALTVELSILGAQRLTTMLGSAINRTISRGLPH